jgi:hypothetical protein
VRGKRIEITVGSTFERLTVVGPAVVKIRVISTGTVSERYYPCMCTCGNIKDIRSYELTSSRTRSCGCLHQELRRVLLRTHGEGRSRLHSAWNNMLNRCRDKGNTSYMNYGGRGITVCDEWKTYMPFRDWALANGYRDDLTIERIDVNGNYKPSNCMWIPKSKQSRNRRNVPLVSYLGENKTRWEWGSDPRCAVRAKTFIDRLKQGWSFERAFTTPKKGLDSPTQSILKT